MRQYLNLLKDIIKNGKVKTDRTGTGTISVFGRSLRFDLSKGFPMVTTKKLHMKSVIHELLWFLSGSTNIRYLQENGVTIWDEWRKPYTLDREVIFLDPIQAEYENYDGNYNFAMYSKPDSLEVKLASTWVNMMKRCYDTNHHNYHLYGAKGVSVNKRWHDPANFIEDAKLLPHWYYKETRWNEFELDKDYYGSNQYGLDTSIWLHTSENKLYTKAAKPIVITDENGLSEFFICLNDAARRKGIPSSTLSRFIANGLPTILKGANKNYLGWEFKEAELKDKLPRLKIIEDGELGNVYGKQWVAWEGKDGQRIDQISQVIEQIKKNPDSRRHLVIAWNPADVDTVALPPCHYAFQFYVSEGKLSCMFQMRSIDTFLGLPFNLASYALLTHMVAAQCDLEVGELIWNGGDTHIYLNHVDQVNLQLTRKPFKLPQLVLKRKPDSIFDYKYEDFEIVNYKSHETIKAPISK